MRLASVSLVGATPQPNNAPTLGARQETRVTIMSNDDANGVWRLFSNSPESPNGQLVSVTETDGVSVSVELVVEREGTNQSLQSYVTISVIARISGRRSLKVEEK